MSRPPHLYARHKLIWGELGRREKRKRWEEDELDADARTPTITEAGQYKITIIVES